MNTCQCLNPDCLRQNKIAHQSCDKCGAKLRLGDRYRATHIIGQGTFGRTFAAVDEHRLNAPV